MDAQPELALIAGVLARHNLEAILIGNMAAALHGAPVTTIDVDFLFRKTPVNLKKLKAVARELGAVVLRPYYPVSGLYRMQRESDGLQIDFMTQIDGMRSYEGIRSRAQTYEIGGHTVLAARLADVIRSKRAAGRPKDRAVLDILEKTLDEEAKLQANPVHRAEAGKRPRAARSDPSPPGSSS